MLAAACAAQRGRQVVLLEKNRKAGVKILMSGGTRCNITQATDRRGIVAAFGRNGSFLHSALAALGPDELVAMFHAAGVATKVESTGKVFPVSDRAVDVRDALLAMVRHAGAELRLGEGVRSLEYAGANAPVSGAPTSNPQSPQASDFGAGFVISTDSGELTAEKVIITTGGQSYPGCGTTGDGYHWARKLGHTIVPPQPALVPLRSPADWVHGLSGVTLPDVRVQLIHRESKKPVAERRGSFLFTHFGLSGPAPMDVSGAMTTNKSKAGWTLGCDFLPAINREAVFQQLAAEARTNGKRSLSAVVGQWLPRRLAEALLINIGVPLDRPLGEVSKQVRNSLVDGVKNCEVPIDGTLGFAKAEVTAGGVCLDEVDSRTMESKLVPGLYLAGELLDLDGPIGGFNFQAAFSTGWLAGSSV